MKFKLFSGLLLFVSTLSTLAPFSTPSAFAGCVMTDVATQVAIHGSKNPAKQTNNVNMDSQPGCGNTTTNTATQLYVGSGDVEQTRDSRHFVGGGTNDGTKVGGTAIAVPVYVPVDVYSPAHNPDFLSGLKPSRSRTH